MRTLLAQPCPPDSFVEEIIVRPRLGFLGVDRNRLQAIARSGLAEVAAISGGAGRIQPGAAVLDSLNELLEVGVDGVVIATPGAGQAEPAIAALERGVAVFCEKPPGRTAAEIARVIDAARAADLLLGVNRPFHFIHSLREIRDLCCGGELGEIYIADVMFHQPARPAKDSSGDDAARGCMADPGMRLLDLALWNLGFPAIRNISSRLFAQGKLLRGEFSDPEDFAVARFDLENGATIKFACSTSLPIGCDPIIAGSFHGTRGGASFHNAGGSAREFVARRFHGSDIETLSLPAESESGRAAIDWVQRVANGRKFDPEIENLVVVADGVDRIYENASAPAP
jgi:predicted dehydrogenase